MKGVFCFSNANGDLDDSDCKAGDDPVLFKTESQEDSESYADDDETSQSSSQPTLSYKIKAEVKQGIAFYVNFYLKNEPKL